MERNGKDHHSSIGMSIRVVDNKIMMAFQQPVTHIGFNAEQALMVAASLIDHTKELAGVPKLKSDLPCYLSHKRVWAIKIKTVVYATLQGTDITGTAEITPEDSKFPPFRVNADYVKKHQPKAGGYFVLYEDGYASWSPAQAFESGYTRI